MSSSSPSPPSSSSSSWRTSPRARLLTPFQRAVYELLCLVPSGRVTTYGLLAKALAEPGAHPPTQAVGNALHANPFAPAVPCHRVLRSGSPPTLGGFNGVSELAADASTHPELRTKIARLAEEGVAITPPPQLRLADPSRVFAVWSAEEVRRAKAASSPVASAAPKRKAGEGGPSSSSGPATAAAASASGAALAAAAGDETNADTDEVSVRARLSSPGTPGSLVRSACRSGLFSGHTSGCAPSIAQANLVILPRQYALDFLLFCVRNPKPCPLLDVTDAGSPFCTAAAGVATGADVRRDLPRYRVWRNGVAGEDVTDVSSYWPVEEGAAASNSSSSSSSSSSSAPAPHRDARTDWVAFLLGCSFSFEEALLARRLPVRHLQQEKEEADEEDIAAAPAHVRSAAPSKRPRTSSSPAPPSPATLLARAAQGTVVPNPRNVPMYRTSILNERSGAFGGRLVVSMRPMTPAQAAVAAEVTAAFPRVHGRCIHWGDPSVLGIADLSRPDYGDAVTLLPGEVPVFWACGVTPQAALAEAKIPIAITHAPGHMLVLDTPNSSLAGYAEFDLAGAKRVGGGGGGEGAGSSSEGGSRRSKLK
jgi:O-6-methylguanine DNA methyltransferase